MLSREGLPVNLKSHSYFGWLTIANDAAATAIKSRSGRRRRQLGDQATSGEDEHDNNRDHQKHHHIRARCIAV